MAYLLDSNVFIEAKNRYYGFDFCPAFWNWLNREHERGNIFSIRQVKSELVDGGDELSDWVQRLPADFFIEPQPKDARALAVLATWSTQQNYEQAAISTFLQIADYYLAALAKSNDMVLVTNEVFSPSAKKIKIPNACIGTGVRFMSPWGMLRTEKARFVLG